MKAKKKISQNNKKCNNDHTSHHHHNHSSLLGHNHSTVKNIKIAFFLNFAFTIFEIIGGLYTGSIAILADAVHDLGDSCSLGLSWIMEKLSYKKRTNRYTYGYRRFSLLAALINSLILIVGTILVIYTAIPRLLNPQTINYQGVLFLAILGVIINGYAAFRVGLGSSLNEKAVSWHLFEDVFGWVLVLIMAVVNLFTSLPILDPIIAIIFSIIVLVNVVKNFIKIWEVFLQKIPKNINIDEIKDKIINSSKDILNIHDFHIWSIDGENYISSLHLVLEDYDNSEKIKENTRNIIKTKIHCHTTIEIEKIGESCNDNCDEE